jgi:dTDP-4-dehydrorhamnose 3,5-epimerase
MQFQFTNTPIEGVKLITLAPIRDDRGWFLKTFHAPTFAAAGLETDFPESFVSLSKRNVIRGMHFQTPPHDHAKIVRCVSGQVLDVALDIRKDSATYGQHITFTLDAEQPQAVYMPRGIAHGFLTLSDEAVLEYNTSTVHHPTSDSGIRWDSFGCDWPLPTPPTLSPRDQGFVALGDFDSPFCTNNRNNKI